MAKPFLSDGMIEVLKMIAVEPRRTHTATVYEWVDGKSAQALVRRGLAKRVYDSPAESGLMWDFSFKIEITHAGKLHLRKLEKTT